MMESSLPIPVRNITPELFAELTEVHWFKERDLRLLTHADFRCEYCGHDLLESFEDCFNAQIDHIQPKSKGGSTEDSNLAASCVTCNALKWDYAPSGQNRTAQLADASRYVREQRQVLGMSWNKYRNLLRK